MVSFKINVAVMSRARACNLPWRLSVAELELKNKIINRSKSKSELNKNAGKIKNLL